MVIWRGPLIRWPEVRVWPWRCQIFTEALKTTLIFLFIKFDAVNFTSTCCCDYTTEQHNIGVVFLSLSRLQLWVVLCGVGVFSHPSLFFSICSSFLPQSQNMHCRLIGDSRLPLGVCACLCVCVRACMHVLFGVYSGLSQWLLG